MTAGMETPPCDVCGETSVAVVFERNPGARSGDAFIPTTDTFHGYGRVVRCVRCGVLRLSPRPAWGALRGEYEASADPRYLDELAGRLASARRMLRLLELVVAPGRLVDVGCGPGALLAAAAPRWRATGVELSRWSTAEARRRGGEVVEGTLAGAAFPDASIDAVTMLDVVEHLPDPREVLAEVRRILRPGGAVLVLTPDVGAFMARAMGAWWWGLRPAHLYYFSARTLRALLDQEGFEVRLVRRVGRGFTFGYWVSRMRGYAPGPIDAASRLIRFVRLDRLPVFVNTFDSIAVVAVRR
ncbi:MAG: class I SAM-dependent methyltransferase [Candidatus Coatesbacteria bacterium]